MPGMTAWAGCIKVARSGGRDPAGPAASGAVGTMAVQLAKQAGARVIGSTGSADKVAYLKTLGADAVIHYRETPDLDAELARLAPEGIHVYFENVGGAMLDAALNHMALHGRIVLCGLIEQYNGQGSGPRNLAQVIRKRILIQGLLVSDHWQHYGEFLAEAIPAFEAGALQAEETVSTGLASMSQAFIGLFEGATPARCWSSWTDPQNWRLRPQTACMTGPSALRWARFPGAPRRFSKGASPMSTPYPRVGVGVILTNGRGQVLLGKRKGSHAPHWSIAGGHLELGRPSSRRPSGRWKRRPASSSGSLASSPSPTTWRPGERAGCTTSLSPCWPRWKGSRNCWSRRSARAGSGAIQGPARASLRRQPPVHRLLAG